MTDEEAVLNFHTKKGIALALPEQQPLALPQHVVDSHKPLLPNALPSWAGEFQFLTLLYLDFAGEAELLADWHNWLAQAGRHINAVFCEPEDRDMAGVPFALTAGIKSASMLGDVDSLAHCLSEGWTKTAYVLSIATDKETSETIKIQGDLRNEFYGK